MRIRTEDCQPHDKGNQCVRTRLPNTLTWMIKEYVEISYIFQRRVRMSDMMHQL
jgi:hypothetical protein